MAETDVEIILREIRERVLAEQRSGGAGELPAHAVSNGNRGNDSAVMSVAHSGNETIAAEKLALLNSYLVTLSRAWDRLPPVVSNRSGLSARIELWLKRHLKRATRWYAWEQINFNATVHHSIRDILQVLTAYQQEFERLQSKSAAERQADTERHQGEIEALRDELETQRQTIEAQRNTIEMQGRTIQARSAETKQQASDLRSELRDHIQHVQEEQRVSFKQLALENSEAAVLEDRARRKTEALLEELKHRVEKMEK